MSSTHIRFWVLLQKPHPSTAAANETAVEEPEAPEPGAEAEEIGASATPRGEIEVYAC